MGLFHRVNERRQRQGHAMVILANSRRIRVPQTRRVECQNLNFMNHVRLLEVLSKRGLNDGIGFLIFQISSTSFQLLFGLSGVTVLEVWLSLGGSLWCFNLFMHWSNKNLFINLQLDILVKIISFVVYGLYVGVMGYLWENWIGFNRSFSFQQHVEKEWRININAMVNLWLQGNLKLQCFILLSGLYIVPGVKYLWVFFSLNIWWSEVWSCVDNIGSVLNVCEKEILSCINDIACSCFNSSRLTHCFGVTCMCRIKMEPAGATYGPILALIIFRRPRFCW
ncbi:unnamed protein product, partial [Brassica rapa subsp. trilocularis]